MTHICYCSRNAGCRSALLLYSLIYTKQISIFRIYTVFIIHPLKCNTYSKCSCKSIKFKERFIKIIEVKRTWFPKYTTFLEYQSANFINSCYVGAKRCKNVHFGNSRKCNNFLSYNTNWSVLELQPHIHIKQNNDFLFLQIFHGQKTNMQEVSKCI